MEHLEPDDLREPRDPPRDRLTVGLAMAVEVKALRHACVPIRERKKEDPGSRVLLRSVESKERNCYLSMRVRNLASML